MAVEQQREFLVRGRVQTWRQQSQWFDALYRVARERRGQIALVILGVFGLSALLAPWIAPHHFADSDPRHPPAGALLGSPLRHR